MYVNHKLSPINCTVHTHKKITKNYFLHCRGNFTEIFTSDNLFYISGDNIKTKILQGITSIQVPGTMKLNIIR